MNRKDITVGAVLAWSDRADRDKVLRDRVSHPVRILELGAEVPEMSGPRLGRPSVQTGTRKAIMAVRLSDKELIPYGTAFEVTTRQLNGSWDDLLKRVALRNKRAEEAEERARERANAWTATHDLVGELSDHGLRRGMLDTRGRSAGRVSIDVDDLLALIKAARTAALNEYEGTGGRND